MQPTSPSESDASDEQSIDGDADLLKCTICKVVCQYPIQVPEGISPESWTCEHCDASIDATPPHADERLSRISDIHDDLAVLHYLEFREYDQDADESEKTRIRSRAASYELQGSHLIKHPTGRFSHRTVPSPPQRIGIIAQAHDKMGHFSTTRVYALLVSRFFWYNMKGDIDAFITACKECRVRKLRLNVTPPMHPIPVKAVGHRFHLDMTGPLTTTEQNNRYIIVAVDSFSKWPEIKALPNKSSELTKRFFIEDIVARHGCPAEIITDNGTEFRGKFDKYLTLSGIEHRTISAYAPESNGLAERFIQTLKRQLCKLVHDRTCLWDNYLTEVIMGYRFTKHASTKFSPFELTYGRSVVLPVDLPMQEQYSATPSTAQEMEAWQDTRVTAALRVQREAAGNIADAQNRMQAAHALQSLRQAPFAEYTIKPGDFVQLSPPQSKRKAPFPMPADPIYRLVSVSSTGITATLEAANGAQFPAKMKRLRLFK